MDGIYPRENNPIEMSDRIKLFRDRKHYVVNDFNYSTDEVWLECRDGEVIKEKISHIEKIACFKCRWF